MPHAVDFDTEGNIFITEYGNKRIQVFSPNWDFKSIIPSEHTLVGPATAYFGQDGNLNIADYGSNSVVKMTKEGKFLGWIGAKSDGTITNGWETGNQPVKSTAPGGFDRVHAAITDNDGTIYAVDTWNNRIQRFSKDGRFSGWIGAKSDGTITNGWEMTGEASSSRLPGGFAAPIALDFANGDELLILEYENHRIQRFSKEGKFLGWFGAMENSGITDGWQLEGLPRLGSELGAFKSPYDLKVFGNTVYVADTSNARIQIISFTK
jgi:sugar lactone lactonase YvrE